MRHLAFGLSQGGISRGLVWGIHALTAEWAPDHRHSLTAVSAKKQRMSSWQFPLLAGDRKSGRPGLRAFTSVSITAEKVNETSGHICCLSLLTINVFKIHHQIMIENGQVDNTTALAREMHQPGTFPVTLVGMGSGCCDGKIYFSNHFILSCV